MAAPLVRARGRGTICLRENYWVFMIFDDFQCFSQHPGLKAKVKVRLRLTLNAKFGGPKKKLCLFLACNATATHGTSAYPPYVGATLPIGGRLSAVAVLL